MVISVDDDDDYDDDDYDNEHLYSARFHAVPACSVRWVKIIEKHFNYFH